MKADKGRTLTLSKESFNKDRIDMLKLILIHTFGKNHFSLFVFPTKDISLDRGNKGKIILLSTNSGVHIIIFGTFFKFYVPYGILNFIKSQRVIFSKDR